MSVRKAKKILKAEFANGNLFYSNIKWHHKGQYFLVEEHNGARKKLLL